MDKAQTLRTQYLLEAAQSMHAIQPHLARHYMETFMDINRNIDRSRTSQPSSSSSSSSHSSSMTNQKSSTSFLSSSTPSQNSNDTVINIRYKNIPDRIARLFCPCCASIFTPGINSSVRLLNRTRNKKSKKGPKNSAGKRIRQMKCSSSLITSLATPSSSKLCGSYPISATPSNSNKIFNLQLNSIKVNTGKRSSTENSSDTVVNTLQYVCKICSSRTHMPGILHSHSPDDPAKEKPKITRNNVQSIADRSVVNSKCNDLETGSRISSTPPPQTATKKTAPLKNARNTHAKSKTNLKNLLQGNKEKSLAAGSNSLFDLSDFHL